MNQLMQEIRQQPEVIARLTTEHGAQFQRAAAAIRTRNVQQVLIAARGTSDNAARYAQYLWGYQHRLPVALATPSLYTVYQTPPRLADTLVIGISQSGTSPDIVSVVDDARAQGMLTLAITNTADSPLAEAAELVLDCHAGVEQAVAATKTYTAQLAAVALLGAALGDDAESLATLQASPRPCSARWTPTTTSGKRRPAMLPCAPARWWGVGSTVARRSRSRSRWASWPMWGPRHSRRPTLCMAPSLW